MFVGRRYIEEVHNTLLVSKSEKNSFKTLIIGIKLVFMGAYLLFKQN